MVIGLDPSMAVFIVEKKQTSTFLSLNTFSKLAQEH